MEENKMSTLGGSLLWFGAAISIAEIMTGTLLAPLGFKTAVIAIVLGHLIGCALLYFAGLIGAKSKKNSMESVTLSFGRYGSVFFSVLNILQLVGWNAVMIIASANAFGSVANQKLGLTSNIIWCVVIGLLILIWVLSGVKNVSKLNLIAVGTLLILSIVLCFVIFRGNSTAKIIEVMSFGAALELSIAMPISWLPLISDYTKNTDKPVKFTLISTLSYFLGSCFMYLIGLGAAMYAGNSDIVMILKSAGLGIGALIIIVFSTTTTSYLDVYSTVEDILNIRPKFNKKVLSIIVCALGTLIAIFTPIEQYQNFLYLIGSVFVPMAAILVTDYFILKKRDDSKKINIVNTVIWIIGFIIYRVFLRFDIIIGSTIPVVIIVMLLSIITDAILRKAVKKNV